MIDISNAEYRAREGISASDLKAISKSPAYFKWNRENPVDSPALLYGRAIHKFILEPDTFFDEFAILPPCDKRTKEGKEMYNQFLEESRGKDIIDAATFQQLQETRDAAYRTPFVKKIIAGEHEKSFFWTDEETGLICKFRPDSFGVLGDQHIIVDYKSCRSAKTEDFIKDANRLLYDVQAAHYCAGMKALTGEDWKFIFVAQEKTAPYLVNILEASDNFMAIGDQARRDLINTYKYCQETGDWYGYIKKEDGINVLSAPKWIEKMMGFEEEE